MVSQPDKTLVRQGEASSLVRKQEITRVLLNEKEGVLTEVFAPKRGGG
jgi:hypothetical protein